MIVRATQEKFTVSVAGVITNEAGEILLLDHVLRPGCGWGFAGGFMEAHEQPEETLRREINEETNLELENIKLLRARTVNRHIEILFSAEARGEARVKSREIKSLDWFTADNLPENMPPCLRSSIKNLLNR